MTALTLDKANNTLAAAGIQLRLCQEGLAQLNKHALFNKAMHHCVKNHKAKQDVLSYLDHLKKQSQDLVYLANQPLPSRQSVPSQKPSAQSASAPAPESAPSQSHPTPTADSKAPNNDRIFVGHHVYGGKAALYFHLTDTRAGDPTLSIDGTPANGRNSYDWTKKTTIQITINDLPSVAAVFFGLTKSVELRHYGANNDKSIKLEHQGNVIFIQMFATDFAVQVPVSSGDAFQIRNLFLRQLLAKHPEVGVEGNLANLKCHAMMMKSQSQPQR